MERSDSKIVSVYGTAIPFRGNNIDTDRIIHARFLKEITFDKMGEYLFYDVRKQDPNNPFDNPRYKGANILMVGKNFGCGSSREHAPQSIMRYGINAIVGESFAEIFAGNCKALGVPAVTASPKDIAILFDYTERYPETSYILSLENKILSKAARNPPFSNGE